MKLRWSLLALVFLLVGGELAIAKQRKDDMSPPIPPKDARYTICCRAISGPDHVIASKQYREQLVRATGLREFYLVHGEGESTLYFGYYREFSLRQAQDAKEAERAQNDRKMLAKLVDSNGDAVFRNCLFVELPTPDPGPAEWNLANTPPEMYWSVQIGAYKDSPQRKQAAVDAVKEARAQGLDAYYYHGDSVSSVCIGTWPREAIKAQESADAKNPDPGGDLLVLPGELPGVTFSDRTLDGKSVRIVAPKVEVVDPTLLAALRKFPSHSVNGMETQKRMINKATGREEIVSEPSFLVTIKHSSGSQGMRPVTGETTAEPTSPDKPAGQRNRPGTGKLRSIGE